MEYLDLLKDLLYLQQTVAILKQLFRSSKGVIFMWFLFVFIGLVYCIAKFIENRYGRWEDQAAELHKISSQPSIAYNQSQRAPEVKSPLLAKFIDLYSEFIQDYLPYLVMAILNVIIVRSWAFNLVNLFLVLVPMWVFNILKLVPPRLMCVSALFKLWWMGWMIGFFINIWTITSF